jgi:hypothetical protein
MNPLAVSGIVFACILGGIFAGMILRRFLPQGQLSAESKEFVQLLMRLLEALTALVLGLMIASAKASFDTQRDALDKLSANIVFLNRILLRYGTEAKDARLLLHASTIDMHYRLWPAEPLPPWPAAARTHTVSSYALMYEKIQALEATNDVQHTMQMEALKTARDIGQIRWQVFGQRNGSIPTPFLVVLVCWLTLLLAGFSLFAPRKAASVVALLICALAVSSAVFLLLELDQPFRGAIQISSIPVDNALEQLGR